MRMIITLAAIVLAVGAAIPRLLDRTGRTLAAPAAMASTTAPLPESYGSRSVVLSRGNGGHFWADARIDGLRLELVVDTGASQVALRARDAARLGLHPSAPDYSIKVSTANGVTRAALANLRMVEIGYIMLRDVQALVHADDGLGVNLLGMSFLSRVRFTHERGKLILEQ